MRNKNVFLAVALSLIPALFYLPLYNGFFQQDEWFGFSQYVTHSGLDVWGLLSYYFLPSVGHFTPLSILVIHSLFSSFLLNYHAYIGISIGLHVLNTLLFLVICNRLFKNQKLATLAIFLFGVMASHFQGTAWVIANISTHLATAFGLLAVIQVLIFSETKRMRHLFASLALVTVSLLFKEITLFLFGLFIVIIFVFQKFDMGRLKRWVLPILIFGSMYIVARGLMALSPTKIADTTVFATQTKRMLVYNFVTIPFKGISQSIIPQGQLRVVAEVATTFLDEKLTGEPGTPTYEIFVVKRSLEVVSLSLSLLLLFPVILFLKYKKSELLKPSVIGLAWVLLGSMIFSLAPERSGLISTIDSRYLYFVSMGCAIYIISILALLANWYKSATTVLVVTLILINVFWLNKEVVDFTQRGLVRREILTTIKKDHPDIPDKAVFYTESDKSFYGLAPEDKILPFQSGLGQTLLSWYYPTEKFPRDFFEDRYLWDILAEGYEEHGGRGFGYFRNFELLANAVIENNLTSESIISYRFDSQTGLLTDNSEEVRGRVDSRKAARVTVPTSQFRTTSSVQEETLGLATDNNRQTKWDSKLAYIKPQYIQINLFRERTISQIDIDSFNNKDQNEVGYRVIVSQNKIDWQEVFYAKRYPPGSSGVVSLYFKPTAAKYVRIEQIGGHKFASWVVYELKIYATTN